MIEWFVASQRLFFDSNQTKEGRKKAYLNARLSFRLILEWEKQQPKSETAKAAVEKIWRISYREIKSA